MGITKPELALDLSRRQTAIGLSLLGLTSLLKSCAKSPHTQTNHKPNFLFLPIDDLNDWIGILGKSPNVKTPNIDALAQSATIFTNAHAQAPICGPSRASLMSGLYPHQTGMYGQVKDTQIRDAVAKVSTTKLLPEYLSNHGYYTAGAGKLFHGSAPENAFDELKPREGGFGPKPEKQFKWVSKETNTDWGVYPETDDEMIDMQTVQWGKNWLQQDRDAPFFLGLGFIRPHAPWYTPQKWFDLYPIESIQLPPWLKDDQFDIPARGKSITAVPQMPSIDWAIENNEWKPILQGYLASISFVDHCVGLAMAALKASAYSDTTYVILFSDNGYHLGEKSRFAKMSLWDRSTRVPLIISGPRITHKKITQPVGLIDLYPTILELADLPANTENAGTSLTPFLFGAGEQRQPVTTEYGKGNFAVSNERFRYIRYDDGSEELYDLQSDPHEWNNIAQSPTHIQIKEDLGKSIPTSSQKEIIPLKNS